MCDFYDICVLQNECAFDFDTVILAQAPKATAEQRGSSALIKNTENVLEAIALSRTMLELWMSMRDLSYFVMSVRYLQSCLKIMLAGY